MTAHPPEPEDPDRRLITSVIRGDPDAVDTWYRNEYPAVYRLALGFLARWDEAEDLSQDAMLHLLDNLHAWDGKRPFRAWRNAVVANLCRDRLRRIAARRKAETATHALELPRRLPAPEDGARRGEVRRILIEALQHMPDREREVFVLRDLEGATSAEASDILGVQEGTVRSLLSLARSRLRRLLGPRLARSTDG